MNNKQEQIIQYLTQQQEPRTSTEIAEALGVKEFSIRAVLIGLTKNTTTHEALVEEVQIEKEIINSYGEMVITTVSAYKIK
jgi:transcriptional antiterminator